MTVCRRGRIAAGATGGISENVPTGLSPTYEAEEPYSLHVSGKYILTELPVRLDVGAIVPADRI
jgi:hypothetical protein